MRTDSLTLTNQAAGTIGPFVLRGGSYWIETLSSASTLLTMGTIPTATQTLTLDATVYTFRSTLAAPNDIQLGASQNAALQNLADTINGTGTPGTTFFAGTTSPHPTVKAGVVNTGGHTLPIQAKAHGNAGKVTSTTTVTAATFTGAALGANSGTIDLEKRNADGVTYVARATQITDVAGQQTISLPPGTYEWVIANFTASDLEITRIPTASDP